MNVRKFENEFFRMFRLIKEAASSFFEIFYEEQGLTKAQAAVLFGLKMKDFSTVGGLAENIMANPGNASTICKKMEQQGLIKRTRSQEDERVVILSLTEEGDKKITNLQREMRKSFEKASEKIKPEQLESIINGFTELENLLKTVNKGEIQC